MSEIIVPAAPGFYALFLSPEGLNIPRQFLRHAVTAWQIHQSKEDGENVTIAFPVCVAMNGDRFDFILQPDGSLVHAAGFVCATEEDALGYALDQEAMYQQNLKSMMQVAAS